MVTAGADREHAGRVHLAIVLRNFFDLLFQVVAMRQAHVAEIGNPAEFVRIDAQGQIKTPHQAR